MTNFPSKPWLAFWSWQALFSLNANAGVIVVTASTSTVHLLCGPPLLTEPPSPPPSAAACATGSLFPWFAAMGTLWWEVIRAACARYEFGKYLGLELVLLSPFLCACYSWYSSLLNIHLTKCVGVISLPCPNKVEWVTFPCKDWSKFKWLISKVGRNNPIYGYFPGTCEMLTVHSMCQHTVCTQCKLCFPPFPLRDDKTWSTYLSECKTHCFFTSFQGLESLKNCNFKERL